MTFNFLFIFEGKNLKIKTIPNVTSYIFPDVCAAQ
jgi:hypothetical protein